MVARPAPSALTLDNLTVIRVALCTQRITRLNAERMRAVCEALGHATTCHQPEVS